MRRAHKRAATGFLWTDLYQLTMSQLYFIHGLHEKEVLFEHFFRHYPDYGKHQAGYCVNAGMETLLDWMGSVRLTRADVDCLRSPKSPSGNRLFRDDYLDWLYQAGSFERVSIRAIPEGRVVHPDVPLTAVQGPAGICQILETPLLNRLNYQILVATKACRIYHSGRCRPLLEFGIRRAQDTGGNAGARAALIGGAAFTSNVGMSHVLGYPPKGTHAHSMVQLFMTLGMTEREAFRAFADAYPDNCILLVDTINTLESGLPNAIKVFEELRSRGCEPKGIRLDSGDLAHLAVEAARRLDDAGFPRAWIVLSGDLDELTIWQIIRQIADEAPARGLDPDATVGRLVYGVGTRLITSWGSPALSAAYKLVGVRENGWKPAIKISDSVEKTANPGRKNAWRIYDRRNKAVADLLALPEENVTTTDSLTLRHPSDPSKHRVMRQTDLAEIEPLMHDVYHNGRRLQETPAIEKLRSRREDDLRHLDAGVKRLVNPHIYHVSLSAKLWKLKQDLIASAHSE